MRAPQPWLSPRAGDARTAVSAGEWDDLPGRPTKATQRFYKPLMLSLAAFAFNAPAAPMRVHAPVRAPVVTMDETILEKALAGELEEEGAENCFMSEVGWADYLDKNSKSSYNMNERPSMAGDGYYTSSILDNPLDSAPPPPAPHNSERPLAVSAAADWPAAQTAQRRSSAVIRLARLSECRQLSQRFAPSPLSPLRPAAGDNAWLPSPPRSPQRLQGRPPPGFRGSTLGRFPDHRQRQIRRPRLPCGW